MDYKSVAKNAIVAAYKELPGTADHDYCVTKVYNNLVNDNKLRTSGHRVEKEKPLKCLDGMYAKPDLTIVLNGRNVCHIEIKCKNSLDQHDIEQAQKFRDAEHGGVPVILANMKPGKPDGPNIRDS